MQVVGRLRIDPAERYDSGPGGDNDVSQLAALPPLLSPPLRGARKTSFHLGRRGSTGLQDVTGVCPRRPSFRSISIFISRGIVY